MKLKVSYKMYILFIYSVFLKDSHDFLDFSKKDHAMLKLFKRTIFGALVLIGLLSI